jgi:hypothetical protein
VNLVIPKFTMTVEAAWNALWFAATIPLIHRQTQAEGYRFSAPCGEPGARPTSSPDETIAKGVMALRRARAYGPLRGNCLSESLALARWLCRRGIEAEIKFGVRRETSRRETIDAHAWVEVGGKAINNWTDARPYLPLQR